MLGISANPVLAMNLVVLLACALCGVGTYLLARRAGVAPPGALVSGMVFAFAPPRFLRLDQVFLATVQWIPFSLAFLHAYLDRGRARDLRLALAFFTAQALTSGHGAVFLAVAAAGLVVYRAALGEPLAMAKRIRDVGVTGAVVLAPVLLVLVAYARVQAEVGLRRSFGDAYLASATDFLASPTYVHAFVLEHLLPAARINENAHTYLFPGYLPLLLALAALAHAGAGTRIDASGRSAWMARLAVALDAVVLAGAALSMAIAVAGPLRLKAGAVVLFSARDVWRPSILAVAAAAVRLAIVRRVPFDVHRAATTLAATIRRWARARRQDPLTFYALLLLVSVALTLGPPLGLWRFVYWLPGFNFIRAASRFGLLAVLALAVLAGAGFDRLVARVSAASTLAACALVAALLAAEFAVPLGPLPYHVDIPPADRWLDEQRKPFVVAELPLPDFRRVFEFEKRQSEYMLHSTAHWQKTVHGWSGFQPPDHVDLYDRMSRFPDEDSLQWLTRFGVRYVVLHVDLYAPDEWARIRTRLDALRGRLELTYLSNTSRVYALEPGA